jgi:hypothetical protein
MHLSRELEKQLGQMNSQVKLASTVDGSFPEEYAFIHKGKRKFRTEFASTKREFSLILYESTNKQEYENCFARGLFTDIGRLANAIDYWSGKCKPIPELEESFTELELFKEPDFKNLGIEIQKAWRKIYNMFFNDSVYWKTPDWNSRYLEMLSEAKTHHAFQNYFPFTSHYLLRFSVDKQLHETWDLTVYITPTINTSGGNFYVSYKDESMSGRYFETVKDALDFYAEKLKEIKPTKWKNS